MARAFGAVCNPEFFGFNADMQLQYGGRLDASRTTLVPDARRELFEAMSQIAKTKHGLFHQMAGVAGTSDCGLLSGVPREPDGSREV